MVERTTRGDEDRKNEDQALSGDPAAIDPGAGTAGRAGTGTTRDKSVEPAGEDARHDDRDR